MARARKPSTRKAGLTVAASAVNPTPAPPVTLAKTPDFAVFQMDLTGIVIAWNSDAEHITGFSETDIAGKFYAILFTPDDRRRGDPERDIRSVLAQGRTEAERWYVRLDGTRFRGRGVLTCVYRKTGKPSGLVKIIRDITAEKKAHDELRRSEQRLRLLVESVRDSALLQIDDKGSVVYWNPGAERIFGYTRQEMAGQLYSRVYSPEDVGRGVPSEDAAQAVAKGRAEYEVTLYRKDGAPFLANWVTEPIWGEDGQLQGFAKVLRDQTESKRAEEQLRKSQKMEALGRLAGGVAHDFNNLLTIMGGYTSLLQYKLGDQKEPAAFLTQIQEAVRRASRLTGQLLAFSRKQVTQPAVLSVNELLSGMERMLRALLGEDIEMILALDPAAGRVKADAGQIEQIIVNLAANARDAMPTGGKLRIETHNSLVQEPVPGSDSAIKPGEFVTVTVADSGHGMDAVTRAHIFEPFFTTKPVSKGTGLGLATCYGIAHQSGGMLTVESQLRRGTSVTLYLPRVRAAARIEAPLQPDEPGVAGTGSILVVEDEPALRKLFIQSLGDAGYSVLDAPDGRSALSLAAQYAGPIDLLVTDVVMPSVGGADLAREMQKHRPGMRVLFVSGYTNEALAERGILRRGTRFLQKPFRIEALLQAVREAIREGQSRGRSGSGGAQ